MGQYRTTPYQTDQLPPGVPYIVGNEAAERFSFYGMRTILYVVMTQYLVNRAGQPDLMTNDEAKAWYHTFVMSAYFFPLIGAIICDIWLGKYLTIVSLSVVYCLGHLMLAFGNELQPFYGGLTRLPFFVGLTLIAIGTGAIKPCVSAHVGDQFGQQNKHHIPTVFGWFYFSINLGAFVSTWLTPNLLRWSGPHLAFGVPGVLMLLATIVFWMGRNKFVHIPPGGFDAVRQALDRDGVRALVNLLPVYLCIAIFWGVYDQTGAAWVQQAARMDLWLTIGSWRHEVTASEIQAVNPLLVLLYIPLFTYVIYPAIGFVFPLTPLRKIAIGFFVTVAAASLSAWIESRITGGELISCTSQADPDAWRAQQLLDGPGGRGWISSEQKTGFETQEIVVRLREAKSWSVSAAEFVQLGDWSQEPLGRKQTELAVADCHVKRVEVFVGNTRKGDRVEAKSDWEWTRRVGEIELTRSSEPQRLTFAPVDAEYVLFRVQSNWGGKFATLGRLDVLTQDDQRVAAAGYKPHVYWQVLAYILITAAEVMISITGLEFSYTQAPNKVKSFVMSLYLLSVSLGNFFTAGVNVFIQNPDGSSKLDGASYYWFFTALVFATSLIFLVVASVYRGETYIQEE